MKESTPPTYDKKVRMTPRQDEIRTDCPKKDEKEEPTEQAAATIEDEDEEWSKLRCTSLRTEEIADKKQRKQRRQNRCADYPGLAFGSAMFGSDTMMKFNIIKNELHNIMRSQLKRVDGEVSALSQRIKALDDNLEKSEQFIKSATQALAEAVAIEMENRRDGEEDEEQDALSQFDAQMALLEGRMRHAKLLAAEAAAQDDAFDESNNNDPKKADTSSN